MPKLIVDDAGTKRAFRLSKGRLTVGSGADSKLTLAAAGVEPNHAAITIRPDGGIVDASAEVRIDGQPALGEGLELRFGATLEIGEASLELEADDAGAQPAAAPKAGARAGAKPAAARSSAGKAGAARSGAGRSGARASKPAAEGAVTPTRRGRPGARAQKPGLPSWMLPAGVVALLLGTFLVYRAVSGGGTNPVGVMATAQRSIDDGQWTTARELLGTLNPAKLSPELAAQHAALLEQAKAQVSEAQQRSTMTDGIAEFGKLLNYESKWLTSEPYERANAHYFLDKLDEVRAAYPDWDSEVWRESEGVWADVSAVLAIEKRALEALGGSRTYDVADVAFRANMEASGGSSGKGKRDYRPAFAALQAGLATAQGAELAELQAQKTLLEAQRAEYAQARLSAARADMQPFLEDPKDLGALMKSAGKLVELMFDVGDATGRQTAINIFTQLPELDKVLDSYKKNTPERFEQLMGEPAVRTAAERIGYPLE